MTRDEARAELEDILLDCCETVPQAEVLDRLLARPELVLAALGTEEVGYQRDPSWRRLFMLPEGTEKP